MDKVLKIVAISDTHSQHQKIKIPKCDILLHSGDESFRGTKEELKTFASWLNEQEAGYILWTPGNHSVDFEKNWPESKNWLLDYCPSLHILNHESIVIEGIKFFGSPWSPIYGTDWAYNGARILAEQALYRKPLLKDLWKQIPDDTQILFVHSPPYEILDEVKTVCGDSYDPPRNIGCVDLRERILDLKELDIFICGHNHWCGGQQVHIDGVSYYNAAICDWINYPSNPVTVIDYLP